jgi:hypothetical protein
VDVGNVSNSLRLEALWALGALEPLKKVKAARRGGWVVVERAPKTAPKRHPFFPFPLDRGFWMQRQPEGK